jgi:hypothetical protein
MSRAIYAIALIAETNHGLEIVCKAPSGPVLARNGAAGVSVATLSQSALYGAPIALHTNAALRIPDHTMPPASACWLGSSERSAFKTAGRTALRNQA